MQMSNRLSWQAEKTCERQPSPNVIDRHIDSVGLQEILVTLLHPKWR